MIRRNRTLGLSESNKRNSRRKFNESSNIPIFDLVYNIAKKTTLYSENLLSFEMEEDESPVTRRSRRLEKEPSSVIYIEFKLLDNSRFRCNVPSDERCLYVTDYYGDVIDSIILDEDSPNSTARVLANWIDDNVEELVA